MDWWPPVHCAILAAEQSPIGALITGSTRVPELYSLKCSAQTLQHEVVGMGNGLTQWGIRTAIMSAMLSTTATSGGADSIMVEQLGTADQKIAYSLAANSPAKSVDITMIGWAGSGLDKAKRFELKGVGMAPNQTIKLWLAKVGQELHIENTGPATSLHAYVNTASQPTPLQGVLIALPAGQVTIVQ